MPRNSRLSTSHGFVVTIGPDNNPNYFTGCGYSAHLDDAKVFLTKQGAMTASRIWQNADYNSHPLPSYWYDDRRAVPVNLQLVP